MEINGITFGQKINTDKKKLSKQLRKKMTRAEKVFWRHVRNRKYPGIRFRRQQIIDGFIVDFYCAKLGVVIELDGEIHEYRKEYDNKRDVILRKRGLRVLRFSNKEVEANIELVLKKIFRC